MISLEELKNESNVKSGFVTLIGRPNVGKSTLMNNLIGQKIAITSKKPQTTRNRIQTVYTDERGQIVFLDTPGIHKAKNKLGNYMVAAAENTLKEVDVILFLVEPETFIGAGEKHIIEQLKRCEAPVVLIINKMDTLKQKEELLPVIEAYSKEMEFDEIIPISAWTGEGKEEVLRAIFSYLPYGAMFYDPDTITDQPERQIVAELIREQALHKLNDEIPHGIAVCIDRMKEKTHIVEIDATIICERDSHKGIIIGKGGSMLKRIGTDARRQIEELLDCQVNLKLWVKVKKDWRDSDYLLKNFGYNQRDE
ncbi:MAG: GTPase Era [Lachnospiraceae bacterium]|nr:GTPase Era [Lachnospiraceae bacterium]